MKIRTTIGLMLVMMTTLVACGAGGTTASATQAEATASGASASESAAASTGTLSAVTQLAIGTLNLEGSSVAVTAEQAKALLPLWQAYRSLSQSDTAAPAEIEALTNQIRETMTSHQTEAIDKMQLTQADLAPLMDKLGLRPALAADATPGARAFQGGEFPQGFAGGGPAGAAGAGGFPGAGGTGGQFFEGAGSANGQGFMINPDATPQAGRAGRLGGERMALMFIEPLLTMLEARAGSYSSSKSTARSIASRALGRSPFKRYASASNVFASTFLEFVDKNCCNDCTAAS
jgi:hypothetical protein